MGREVLRPREGFVPPTAAHFAAPHAEPLGPKIVRTGTLHEAVDGRIGFQGDRDRSNFVSCLERLLPEATVEHGTPHLLVGQAGRQTVVGTFPIGIDLEAFERDAERPEIAAHAAELRRRVSDDVLVLGVDRLDYTKGIPERLK